VGGLDFAQQVKNILNLETPPPYGLVSSLYWCCTDGADECWGPTNQ